MTDPNYKTDKSPYSQYPSYFDPDLYEEWLKWLSEPPEDEFDEES